MGLTAAGMQPTRVCDRCRKVSNSTTFRPRLIVPGRYCDPCNKTMAAPNDPKVVAAYDARMARYAADAEKAKA